MHGQKGQTSAVSQLQPSSCAREGIRGCAFRALYGLKALVIMAIGRSTGVSQRADVLSNNASSNTGYLST